MTIDLETKLAELRIEWVQNPERRDTIEEQVKIAMMSKNAPTHIDQDTYKSHESVEEFMSSVQEALLNK